MSARTLRENEEGQLMSGLSVMRHARELVEQGFTIVEGFLSPDEVARAQEIAYSVAPSWEQHANDPERYPVPSRLQYEFPDFPAALQDNVVRADLLALLEEVIGTPDLRLSLSFLWFKYASAGFREQELHSDMMNQTLTYPRDDGIYRQVVGALYYTDVPDDLSPTCVLSRQVDELAPGGDIHRRRADHPDHYEREVKVAVPAGSLLLYGLSTFHRGGALTAAAGLRVSHHFAFRSSAVEWGQWRGWAKEGLKPELASFLTQATPRQRNLLGFPLPGDPFWTKDVLTGLAARYPDMDLAPYREALA
jgi:hypothetical protein